ncbi:hypothetical protein H4R20_002099 [Coemansia guatemalensis]|uniref:Reverse transcriptase domain-containing protein n=1 Tax=Coemansia guatemalensis TaxID=2761395 RepID=A0A9W8HW46_9FUNG|nr:hypothetical protein H4R20_002099 [Coemansia guatemalensis]
MWSGMGYRAYGHAYALAEIADGSRRWLDIVVVNNDQKWELLLSNSDLECLDVRLETPAMHQQMRDKVREGQGVQKDGSTRMIMDNDYADLPVPENMADIQINNEPIELMTDAQAATMAAAASEVALGRVEIVSMTNGTPTSTGSCSDPGMMTEALPKKSGGTTITKEPSLAQCALPTLRPRKMHVKLGLPANFFMYECNDDFYCWDKLYLAVTKEQVRQRIVHQLDCPKDVERLLDNLMTGVAALRMYPSGCLPLAAIKLLHPPMREGAKLVYTLQHPMSNAAQATRKKFVETRLNYGIDEKTRAHAQMPVFTKPKPNTDARWVLFDDSANNELNMVHTGVQLALPAERIQFLKNAKRLSSVDLASFFTSMWLAEDVRDFWCYQGGSHGRVWTTWVVQGNSESPAIAQSFIQHVLGEVPELQGKLLMYIDNIYLKTTTDDLEEHLHDLGFLARALVKYNLLFNVSKSIFAVTDNVEVLGMLWSAKL